MTIRWPQMEELRQTCSSVANVRRETVHIHRSVNYNIGQIISVTRSFIYLGFYVAFNTVQVISRWVVGRAEETSTYSSSGFCTVNCPPTASNYQLSHLRLCQEPNPGLRGGRQECYHSATVPPPPPPPFIFVYQKRYSSVITS